MIAAQEGDKLQYSINSLTAYPSHYLKQMRLLGYKKIHDDVGH